MKSNNTPIPEIIPGCPATHSPALLADLWNGAVEAEFALSAAHFTHRLQSPPPWPQTYALAYADGVPRGFVLISATPAKPENKSTGHIEAIAVHPAYRRQGLGRSLLNWAAAWARSHDCDLLFLGNGPQRLLPGLPANSPAAAPLVRLGFNQQSSPLHDLVIDVAGYEPPDLVTEIPGLVRPLGQAELQYLESFLHTSARAGSTSAHMDHALEHFIHTGGRLSDLMSLWTNDGLQGVLRLVFEDSSSGIEPWFPYTLPKPWAAITSLHLSSEEPAYRWAMLDAALRRLHNNGVNSCILGDIQEPSFYTTFGFQTARTYYSYTLSLL
jgi:GNAT superfamily N-acetyltransferase